MDAATLARAEEVLAHGDPRVILAPLLGADVQSVNRCELLVRPGRSVTLRLEVVSETAAGLQSQGWVVAAGSGIRGTHQMRVRDGAEDCELQVWRVRDDPVLKGLRACLEPDRVRGLLCGIGIPDGELAIALRSVRPLRRAVVEARLGQHVVFLKCVPPGRAAALHERHSAAAARGVPVPRSLGLDDALGIVALAPLHGDSLRDLLLGEHQRQQHPGAHHPRSHHSDLQHRASPGQSLCDPDEVLGLAAEFSSLGLRAPARSLREVGLAHLTRLPSLLPGRAAQIGDLAERLRSAPPLETTGVHGDFYDAQLLVGGGRITGVVDIDGAGVGERGSDEGNLLAHLDVLGLVTPSAALTDLRVALEERTHTLEGVALMRAAALAGLAAWPHTQRLPEWERRTEEILDQASRVVGAGE